MEERLLVDSTLIKLGKRLRIIGFDVEIVLSKNVLEVLRKGKSEGRTIITKNSKLFQKAQEYGVACVLLKSNDLGEQLRELSRVLKFKPSSSRCPECNVRLQPVPKEKVFEKVPLFVFLSHEEFSTCEKCRRIYWRGSHFSSMSSLFEEVGKDGKVGEVDERAPRT